MFKITCVCCLNHQHMRLQSQTQLLQQPALLKSTLSSRRHPKLLSRCTHCEMSPLRHFLCLALVCGAFAAKRGKYTPATPEERTMSGQDVRQATKLLGYGPNCALLLAVCWGPSAGHELASELRLCTPTHHAVAGPERRSSPFWRHLRKVPQHPDASAW